MKPMATETPMARIPFRVEDELMIESMARWMGFIGILTVINGVILALASMVIVLAVVVAPAEVTDRMGDLGKFIEANRILLGAFSLFALALAGLTVYAGSVLTQAADCFTKVARTDLADQSYVANGLDLLKLWLQIVICTGIIGALVGLGAALVFVAVGVAKT
jgi:hypothetical protein